MGSIRAGLQQFCFSAFACSVCDSLHLRITLTEKLVVNQVNKRFKPGCHPTSSTPSLSSMVWVYSCVTQSVLQWLLVVALEFSAWWTKEIINFAPVL